MRIAASEFILFCDPPERNVKTLGKIVPEVELMLDGDAWDHEPEGWTRQAELLKGCGVPLTVHPPAWDVNAAAPIAALRDAAARLNAMAARLCAELGGSSVVFHPGYYDGDSNFSKTKARDRCYEQLEKLINVAKPLGLTIAFENIAGPRSTLFDRREFVRALDSVDGCVRFLLDVGHANMNGWDIPGVIEDIADRLCAFHLHDNDGGADSHLPMGRGSVDWERVFAAMRPLPESCLYVMEYAAGTPVRALEEGRDLLLGKLS